MVSDALKEELIAAAHAAADAAREPALQYFRELDLSADDKPSMEVFDPVTEADRAAERAMREILAKRRPDDAILGEEYGYSPGNSGFTWVLDPIDGTRAYLCGSPTWGILIGLTTSDGPVFGLIDQPYIDERFEGGFGQAKLAGYRGSLGLATRAPRPLAQATLLSTYPEVGNPHQKAGFDRVSHAVRLTRYGMDCYGYALLAAGQVDLVIEAGLQPYDICAPIAVIEAAGGIVTDWSGGKACDGGEVIAAANTQIHREALALLCGGKP